MRERLIRQAGNKEYRENYDRIFGKKQYTKEEIQGWHWVNPGEEMKTSHDIMGMPKCTTEVRR